MEPLEPVVLLLGQEVVPVLELELIQLCTEGAPWTQAEEILVIFWLNGTEAGNKKGKVDNTRHKLQGDPKQP